MITYHFIFGRHYPTAGQKPPLPSSSLRDYLYNIYLIKLCTHAINVCTVRNPYMRSPVFTQRLSTSTHFDCARICIPNIFIFKFKT